MPASRRGGPGSSPGQVVCDLWCTVWYWGRFSPSTSVSPANSHSTNCSALMNNYINDAMYSRRWRQTDRQTGTETMMPITFPYCSLCLVGSPILRFCFISNRHCFLGRCTCKFVITLNFDSHSAVSYVISTVLRYIHLLHGRHIVTCKKVRVTKITGSSSDDWIC
jgi:hypothetical protein